MRTQTTGSPAYYATVPMSFRRRIWCETLPLDELAAPSTAVLLRRFGVQPILAVWPETATALQAVVARFSGEGLSVALWPMLPDGEGRWLSVHNARCLVSFAEQLVTALAPAELVLDLEPPIDALRDMLASPMPAVQPLLAGADPGAFRAAQAQLGALAAVLAGRATTLSAAITPPILFHAGWERWLGTPVAGVAWDQVNAMLYTSIGEGWSRGWLRRDDLRAMLAGACRAAQQRFGERAGVSLGAVGVGAFGNEPTYRSVAELAEDVAIARAAGVDDLALFDLGGVLRRPPAEAWLEAFTETPLAGALPPATLRSAAVLSAMRAAGSAFALRSRMARHG